MIKNFIKLFHFKLNLKEKFKILLNYLSINFINNMIFKCYQINKVKIGFNHLI